MTLKRKKKGNFLKRQKWTQKGRGGTRRTFIYLYIDKTEVLLILNSEFIHAVTSLSEVPHFTSKTCCVYINITISKTEEDFKHLKMSTNKPPVSGTVVSLP